VDGRSNACFWVEIEDSEVWVLVVGRRVRREGGFLVGNSQCSDDSEGDRWNVWLVFMILSVTVYAGGHIARLPLGKWKH
jgi:hypothetical protein